MTDKQIPTRSEIPVEATWNAESVFADRAAWQAELKDIQKTLPELSRFVGRLGENPQTLLDALDAVEKTRARVYKIYVYASVSNAVDNNDQVAASMVSQAGALVGQAMGSLAFIDPELLSIGQEKLQEWMSQEEKLRRYEHYFEDLFRRQPHVRSGEVEQVLGLARDPFSSVGSIYNMLADADLKFKPAVDSQGREVEVNQSSLFSLLDSPDRELRRTAWENFHDGFLAFKNTFAANLATSIKTNVFHANVRKYSSTLEAALFDSDLPVSVYENLIDTFRKHLPTWHRYWRAKRKALGLKDLHTYDLWAPLTGEVHVPYQQAVTYICEGLSPLGSDYIETIRRGCLQDRWVDIYPNQGKTGGAFSSGCPGTFPFIVMSFNENTLSLGTLAHELGHSMHSYLTWQNQPVIYSDYSMFVAEVASNFHQAMVRAHLLETNPDPQFQLAVIQEAMSNFHRYFLIMPTLARFELDMHRRVERGEGLTADLMNNTLADLWQEGYGDELVLDRERDGIAWATFGHLYVDYYVFQYATGISAANALAQRVRSGGAKAAQDYRKFLSAGSSLYPLEALKVAGVDMTSPEPVEAAFGVLEGLVERLEKLTG